MFNGVNRYFVGKKERLFHCIYSLPIFLFCFFLSLPLHFSVYLQLGSYFGAELCVLSASGLLAVGAPLYHTQGVGGEVHICPLHTGVSSTTHIHNPTSH